MNIENSVVLVTGANRGIGLAFARELLARGARKVYAAARDPASVTLSGVQALKLDVTRPEEIAAAARAAADVNLVINNAGIAQPGGFLASDSEMVARHIFETNFFGVLNVSKSFAPVLKANGGGALVNVLSVASWVNGGVNIDHGQPVVAGHSIRPAFVRQRVFLSLLLDGGFQERPVKRLAIEKFGERVTLAIVEQALKIDVKTHHAKGHAA